VASPGARRGTAVHRVMECLDFIALSRIDMQDEKAVEAFVRQELERMLRSGELIEEWYRLVPPAMIDHFVKSPVALRMAQAAVRGDLYREKPFVMQYEDVLVQGIIDVFWLEGDAIVLLDYKTDRVQEGQELVLRYKTQLELYADALSRVFSNEQKKMTAEEKLLYSFRLQEVIAL
jgi:ATP-dependent helicase/nuclease subunit A